MPLGDSTLACSLFAILNFFVISRLEDCFEFILPLA